MILFPHLLVGAAIGSRFKKAGFISWPFLIFLALAFHYFLDAVPHLDYDVAGLMDGLWQKNFFYDSFKISSDIFLGLFFIFFLAAKSKNFPMILAGALISLVPDLIIFLDWQSLPLGPFGYLVNFGHFFHVKPRYNYPLLGIVTQAIAVIVAFIILNRGRRNASKVAE